MRGNPEYGFYGLIYVIGTGNKHVVACECNEQSRMSEGVKVMRVGGRVGRVYGCLSCTLFRMEQEPQSEVYISSKTYL